MSNLTGAPNVAINLSDHPLTEQDYSFLNKGLKFGILPIDFDFLSTQSTFAKLLRPMIVLELKTELNYSECQGCTQGGVGDSNPPSNGLSTKMHNKAINLMNKW